MSEENEEGHEEGQGQDESSSIFGSEIEGLW